MLPYEVDIEDPPSEEESSSVSSEGLLTPSSSKEPGKEIRNPNRFMRIAKRLEDDKKNSDKFKQKSNFVKERRGSVSIGEFKDTERDEDTIKTARHHINLE